MICELCNKQPATVHVTEITRPTGQSTSVQQKHVCESCAQSLDLPAAPVVMNKGVLDIWKLLRQSAQKAKAEGSLTCPHCGMSLAEFRSKGRLGCPRDYEVFRAHLEPLLLRVHSAKEHRGRLPGTTDAVRSRTQQLDSLKAKLEAAIRDEAYESAARLRDEIQELEGPVQRHPAQPGAVQPGAVPGKSPPRPA
jgi:protein arginine kinase activator